MQTRLTFRVFAVATVATFLFGNGTKAQNTANNYIGSGTGNVTTATNWSLGHVPTVNEDAVFTSTSIGGIKNFGSGATVGPALTVGSVNVTAATGTYSIRNATTSGTNATLTLGGPGNLGNSVSGNSADLLFAATGSTLQLLGDNPNGAGVLNVVLGQSGSFNAAGTIVISAAISDNSGAFGITKTGTGALTFSGANSYSGGTTLSSGTINLSGSGTLGTNSNALTVNGGTLNLGGTSQTVGALSGTGGLITSSTGSSSLTVGNGGGSGSYAGSITNTGTIAFTKAGGGTQTLTANNSYTGPTTISGGILNLANTGGVALSGTSGVTVNNGGTLLMGANNQINLATTPPITLGSVAGAGTAKLDAGGFSQGIGGAGGQVGLGALTLMANSTIDLPGTSLVHFANSSASTWTGTLSILDWSGTLTTGGGLEQILFGTSVVTPGITVGQLAMIQFVDPVGLSPGTYAAMFATGDVSEIVPNALAPVPEPSTWAAGALALAAIGHTQRRRFLRLITRAG